MADFFWQALSVVATICVVVAGLVFVLFCLILIHAVVTRHREER